MASKSWKARLGALLCVRNARRKFGANKRYFHVRLELPHGREVPALFTRHQLRVALKRARKNPEDLVRAPFLLDLLD